MIFLLERGSAGQGGRGDSDLPPMPPWTPYTPFKRPRDTPGPPLWRKGYFPLFLDRQGPYRARTFGLAWGQQPIGCRGGYAPCMAPMPGRVPLHRGAAVAAPCRHSKDKPAPMEPGEGSAAPKATVALPGTRCEPSWARPCEASGALLLSNGGSGGGHETCTLWTPPAPFGYFPARGKYLVRPQAGETSHKKQISCERQETGLPFFLPYHKGFRLCGGDQGAFRSPPGPLRGPSLVCVGETSHKKQISCGRQEKGLPFFSCIAKDFASAEATRGLSDRPLDPFGGLYSLQVGETFHKKQISCRRQSKSLSCFFTYRRSYYP